MLLLAALGWFSCLYAGLIKSKESEKQAAYSLPVEVTVCNLQGTATDGLMIVGRSYEALTQDAFSDLYISADPEYETVKPYVKDVKMMSVPLYYSISEDGEMLPVSDQKNTFIGITCLEAVDDFDPVIGNAKATLIEGSDGEGVIVPQAVYEKLEPDDNGELKISLRIARLTYGESPFYDLESVVSGYYSGDGSSAIYCPWELYESIAADRLPLNGSGTPGYAAAQSFSATVADNTRLDRFKQVLSYTFSDIDPSGKGAVNPNSGSGERYTLAAVVHDETLRNTLASINRSIGTMNRLRPVILLLEMVISAAASYFYIHTRKRELAVARSLGTRRSAIISTLALEMLIWAALAFAAASLASAVTPLCVFSPAYIAAAGLASVAGAVISGVQVTGRAGILGLKEEN